MNHLVGYFGRVFNGDIMDHCRLEALMLIATLLEPLKTYVEGSRIMVLSLYATRISIAETKCAIPSTRK